jgi:putative flippase GtrA
VTADADGQHLPQDILKILASLEEHPDRLWLGSRTFSRDIPLRSMLGNRLTRRVFRFMVGQDISDTQTGLRGIPRQFMAQMLTSPDSKYDFEIDMLIQAAHHGLAIEEVAINTVYLDDNASSHFSPVVDSLKIYFVFLRFSILSMTTALLDYGLFVLTYSLFPYIFASFLVARIGAGLFNYGAGRIWVFKSRNRPAAELGRYIFLVLGLMLISYGLVTSMVVYLGFNAYAAKALAEGLLFLLSFAAQNQLVFNIRETSESTDWSQYYLTPAKTALFTRRATEKALHKVMDEHLLTGPVERICELGGANSAFFAGIQARFPDAHYTIIDNNQTGLNLFRRSHPGVHHISLINRDLLQVPAIKANRAELVFSVGLIEHFDPEGTARVIKAHFDYAAPGALVIITFPTPTWLYRLVRGAAEVAGMWRFPDERPLAVETVREQMSRYGTVLHTGINWGVILTQGMVAVRKSENQDSRDGLKEVNNC